MSGLTPEQQVESDRLVARAKVIFGLTEQHKDVLTANTDPDRFGMVTLREQDVALLVTALTTLAVILDAEGENLPAEVNLAGQRASLAAAEAVLVRNGIEVPA